MLGTYFYQFFFLQQVIWIAPFYMFGQFLDFLMCFFTDKGYAHFESEWYIPFSQYLNKFDKYFFCTFSKGIHEIILLNYDSVKRYLIIRDMHTNKNMTHILHVTCSILNSLCVVFKFLNIMYLQKDNCYGKSIVSLIPLVSQ